MSNDTQSSLFSEFGASSIADQSDGKSIAKGKTLRQTAEKSAADATLRSPTKKRESQRSQELHTSSWPRYLSDKEVGRYFSVSKATVWRWAKEKPEFPKPYRLSPGTSRWRLEDLIAFEATLQEDAE
ncbi:MAG: hypothetical protein K5905_23860 [Roseibium sp.]|uniref:helix-turn-helix transcriptional regulator n=1 Tax=Roseibium sp. TaxID=1936156 RepID=UPI00262B8344|nr:hypothetical protein [Roseibium sp.]MCV0428505.1 hypothetical protein [Roseibium sp.]